MLLKCEVISICLDTSFFVRHFIHFYFLEYGFGKILQFYSGLLKKLIKKSHPINKLHQSHQNLYMVRENICTEIKEKYTVYYTVYSSVLNLFV